MPIPLPEFVWVCHDAIGLDPYMTRYKLVKRNADSVTVWQYRSKKVIRKATKYGGPAFYFTQEAASLWLRAALARKAKMARSLAERYERQSILPDPEFLADRDYVKIQLHYDPGEERKRRNGSSEDAQERRDDNGADRLG